MNSNNVKLCRIISVKRTNQQLNAPKEIPNNIQINFSKSRPFQEKGNRVLFEFVSGTAITDLALSLNSFR
jgi:hypothetical protein